MLESTQMKVFVQLQLASHLRPWLLCKGPWNSFTSLTVEVEIKITLAVEWQQAVVYRKEVFK